jgi:hypothetical protein
MATYVQVALLSARMAYTAFFLHKGALASVVPIKSYRGNREVSPGGGSPYRTVLELSGALK